MLWEPINALPEGPAQRRARSTTPNPGIRSASNAAALNYSLWVDDRNIPATSQPEPTGELLTFEPSPETTQPLPKPHRPVSIGEAPRRQTPIEATGQSV